MYNEKFIGMITSVTAGIKTEKDKDGNKIKIGKYKVKLESADIDYQSIEKFNANISATLLNIQPMPFNNIDFGDQTAFNMVVKFYLENDDAAVEDLSKSVADYGKVKIINLKVRVKENIPIYIFTLEIPMEYQGDFLFRSLKSKISFEFVQGENNV